MSLQRSASLLKRRSSRAPFLLWACLAISVGAQSRYEFEQAHMGTKVRITLHADDAAQAKSGAEAAFARIAEIDRICSDYQPTSELLQLCRAQTMQVNDDLWSVIEIAQNIALSTDGAFDITLGHASQQWRRSRRKGELPSAADLARVRPLMGHALITMQANTRTIALAKPGMQLDLGGIAKGYAADAALKVLMQRGLTSAVVAASGDLAIGDAPPGEEGWPVKLRTFEAAEASDRWLTLKLTRCGVSTSGDLHQSINIAGQRYSHIVDPKTGLGLTQRIACSVIARDATHSDALATAMCVMGATKGGQWMKSHPGLAADARWAEIASDGKVAVRTTPSFP